MERVKGKPGMLAQITDRKKKNVQIEKKVDNYCNLIVFCTFVVLVGVYAFLASKATTITYMEVDEDLYISMARSLFFDHNISRKFEYLGYSCVLYSMLISLAYFFYSPENILFIMRLIGVISMCSAIFPVYLLAREVFKRNKNRNIISVALAILSVCIPEMAYGSLMLQETLMYPVFMWMMYFSYKDFQIDDGLNWQKYTFLAILFSFLCYATKTFAIIFPVAYCVALSFSFLFNQRSIDADEKKVVFQKILKKLVLIISEYALLFLLWKGLLLFLNDFQAASTHYDSQISSIFPITSQTIWDILRGIAFYLFYFLLYIGIVPVLSACSGYRKMDREDQSWVAYIVGSCALTLLEVVITIYIPENSSTEYPGRIHLRYLFYYFVPFVIVYYKYSKIRINFITVALLAFCAFGVLFLYNSLSLVGIDALFLKYIQKMQSCSGFNKGLKLGVLISLLVFLFCFIKNKYVFVRNVFSFLLIFMLIAVTPYSWEILLSNSESENLANNGYVSAAQYIYDNDISNVYYLKMANDSNVKSFRNYLTCDYRQIYLQDGLEYTDLSLISDDSCIVVSKTFPYTIEGAEKVEELDSYYFDIYEITDVNGNIRIDMTNPAYELLYGSYYVNGTNSEAGIELYNQGYIYGPYISVSANSYTVVIEGENLENITCNAYCDGSSKKYEIYDYVSTGTSITFSIEVDEDTDNFELYICNNSENSALISKEEMAKQ